MMKRTFLILALTALLGVTGCNSGTNPIVVTISSPTGAQALDIGQSFNITASVTNDKLAKGATFVLSGAGTLSNQTATSATYTASASGNGTITIASASDPTKMKTISVVVTAAPAITSAATLSPATEGTAYTGTIAVTGGAGSLNYSVTVGSLPAGFSLNSSTGAITGTATGPGGTVNFTVQVKDSSTVSPQTNSRAMSVTINLPPAPQISTTTLPAGVEGTAYNQPLAITGGLAPFTYSISAGSLPAGLSINGGTGAVVGTPTGPNGTASFTVKVADSSNPVQSATQPLSIAVNLPPAPSITTLSLPADVEGTAYNQTVAATGGLAPLTYSLSVGSLPAGLNLNSGTGKITGAPTGPNGTSSFTVKVADSSNPSQSASQPLSIAVNLPPPPAITTTTLPGVVEFATNYNQTIAATGYGPLVYSINVGSLPAGMVINSSTGAITGTPTGPAGTISFSVVVGDKSNPVQTASQALSIAVSLPPAPSITTSSLPNGTVGANYNQAVAFTGGHGPFAWSISAGALPTGFSLNAATGAITGACNTASTFNFTVKVVDSSNPVQNATQALSISVVNGPLLVTLATLPTGAVNDPYPSTPLGASGGLPPYTWAITVGSLPAGLNLNSSTGAITGSPTGPSATANFTAQVTDSTNTKATGSFSIIVNPALVITSTSLPGATAGTNYSTNLSATGGVTPYNWTISVGSLPTGMNLSGNTISGTPTTAGTVSFTIKVNDGSGGSQSAAVSIVVAAAPPLTVATTSGNLPQGVVNSSYPSTQLNATGGFQPYTSWIVVAPGTGTLPPGLSLSSGGQIAGTPTTAGTYPFTVQVTDSATPTANTAQANLSITVNAAPTCVSGGSESLLSGQYAILLKGFDNGTGAGETSPEPVLIGGVLTFNGTGTITAGTVDTNGNSTAGIQTHTLTSGSYGVTSDHRGCMVINTAAGIQNYRFSLGSITSSVASTGHVIGFDSTGPFTAGVLRRQTSSAFSTSQVTGNFAFGVSSIQNSASSNNGIFGGKFGAIGVFNLSSGSITGGEVDFNNNGQLDGNSLNTNWPASPISINTGGTYTISGTNGRGTLSFTPAATGASVVNTVIYVVSTTDVLVLSSDDQTVNSLFAGEFLKQSTSSFSANPLSGAYLGYQSSLGNTAGTSRATLILLNVSGTGISGTQIRNDGGSFNLKSLSGITYSVTPAGRMSLVTGSTPTPLFYLVSPNQAFFLNSDGAVDTGVFQSQTGGPFTNSSANGAYAFGTIDPQDANAGDNSGVATFTPATTNISVIEDGNSNGSQNTGQTQSFTYSIDSTGLVHIPSGCTVSATSTTCQTVLYLISPAKAVIMDTGSTNPKVQVADQ